MQCAVHGDPADTSARLRRADPAATAGAGRARQLLRQRFLRDPRPVAAAPVAPPAPAERRRPAGAGARGRQRLAHAAGAGQRRRRAGPPAAGPARRSDEPTLAADRRHAARVLAERARVASETVFARKGAEWEEMQALGLPAQAVEDALLALLPDDPAIAGCSTSAPAPAGCWNCWRRGSGWRSGVDASRAMLALARSRLARPDGGRSPATARSGSATCTGCRCPTRRSTSSVMQMVLHHAEDPPAALAEAARVLRPGRPAGRGGSLRRMRTPTAPTASRIAGPASPMSAMRALLAAAGLAAGAVRASRGRSTSACSLPKSRLWSRPTAPPPCRPAVLPSSEDRA